MYQIIENAPPRKPPVKVQPISVPEISVDELREVTENYGSNALIGEGSYGRVYYGVLKNGRAAAIKKLDASKQPDDEFLSQVRNYNLNKCDLLYKVPTFITPSLTVLFAGFHGVKAKS